MLKKYAEKTSQLADEFFQELRQNPEFPKTSQPAPGDFRRTFEFLSSHFEHVAMVSLSAQVSGTYQAAAAAATRVEGPGRGKAGGHGLGLAFVAEATEAHRGLIECSEGIDGGARFRIRLPRR